MVELLRKLRPAYFPPNRKLIGNEILEEVYMETDRSDCKKEVTLVQDGWGTNQTQPVVAHSVHSGSKAFFLNAVAPGSATKDADYCLGVLSAAIEECQNVHKCQVIGFVTDNCNVMLSLRNKLHESHPDIFVFGCNAHYLNLVGQKVIPHDKIDNIVKIQKYFKNHHFQSAALSAAKGKRPVLPGLTRWNSQIDCIENYIENHAIYLDLRVKIRKFDNNITQMINDFSLYTAAEKLKSLAKPIAVALDKVQSNSASLSDAVSEWIKLRNDCPFENDSCYTYFQRKLTEALNETALAAYILDPRYRGNGTLLLRRRFKAR
ncbi:hypothetical protein Ocin01_17954 [Orchesella cincta]|uniref:DUF659 domain-containing protein n=1 Tax=Orchesella cincta TaxID=48709 RepID=A0A1D2M6Y1_ORCCI|nr:hypothetical protein Ocin01_17954 [Orchesella cincta]